MGTKTQAKEHRTISYLCPQLLCSKFKMQAARTFKAMVTYHTTTRYYKLQDQNQRDNIIFQ